MNVATGSAFDRNYQALSIFRIAFSAYLLIDYFINLARYFPDFYGETGIYPTALLFADFPAWMHVLPNIYTGTLTHIAGMYSFSILYGMAVICLGLGLRARGASVVVFLLHFFLFHRNPYILAGSDLLAHLMLVWCMFAPINRYWSVDAAMETGSRDRLCSRIPIMAAKLQVCSVYLFAVFAKLLGEPWREGYALLWVLNDNVFGATSTARFLTDTVPSLLVVADYLVIAFQLAFTLLVFSPWRNTQTRLLALACAVVMHLSFILCLNIGSFPILSICVLLVLVPDAWIDSLLAKRRSQLKKVTIFYEPECSFCHKVSLLLREFLLTHQSPVRPASDDAEILNLLQKNNSWVVQGRDGETFLKWRGISHLLQQNLALSWLGRLMDTWPLRRPLERLYDLVGRHRRGLGALTRHLLKFRRERVLPLPAVVICALLVLLGLGSNVHSVARLGNMSEDSESRSIFDPIDQLADAAQVRQRWYLFAPVPTHFRWTFEIRVHTDDGQAEAAAEALSQSFFTEKADASGYSFANNRWLKYFTRIQKLSDNTLSAFGRYLCRRARQQAELSSLPEFAVEVYAGMRDIQYRSIRAEPRELTRRFVCTR